MTILQSTTLPSSEETNNNSSRRPLSQIALNKTPVKKVNHTNLKSEKKQPVETKRPSHLRRPRTDAVADMEEFWTLKRATPVWEDDDDEEKEASAPILTTTTSGSSRTVLYTNDDRTIVFR